MPKDVQYIFYNQFDWTFKTCNKCRQVYPKHKLFFSKHPSTSDGYHYCKQCFSNTFQRIINNENNDRLKLSAFIFKKEISGNGYVICANCLNLIENNIELFARGKCRSCNGIKRLDSLYPENLKLAKEGKKKCVYCLDIKDFSLFKSDKNKLYQWCLDCEDIAKNRKREYDKEYLQSNLKSKREYYKKWKLQGGNSIRKINEQKRRSIKNNLLHDFTNNDWHDCLNYFNNSCAYCGMSTEESFKVFNISLHQEHVIPVSKGGDYTRLNIIPSCNSCNSVKNNRSFDKFFEIHVPFTQERYDNIKKYFNLLN